MQLFLATAVAAFLTSLCLTPLVRRLALRWDVIDRPDGHRKLHTRPTPLGGGVVILLAFLAAVVVALTFSHSQRAALGGDVWLLIGLIASAVSICALGLFDDRFGLRGRQKLAGQIFSASLLMISGLWIENINIFGLHVSLGLFAIPFTLFWLVGAINALNLLDGVDGLATSVGIVLSISIGVMAILTGNRTEAFLAFAMAGALMGFLIYNRPRASIFLGDAGSMLVGLILGALAIRASLKGAATVALAAPTAIWAIPILDAGMAILRRKLTGQSIYVTDHGHLHHLVERRGWHTVMFIGLLCAITSVAAIISVFLNNENLALGTIFVVFTTLAVTGVFGRQEFWLLGRRLRQFVRTLVPFGDNRHTDDSQMHTRLQGTHKWEELWDTLTEFAERFDLSEVRLNVVMPTISEEYHASWSRKEHPTATKLWRSEIPLTAHDATVGRLSIAGASHGDSVCTWMADLIAGLQPFETHLLELLGEEEQDQTSQDGQEYTQLADDARISSHLTTRLRA